MPANPSSAALRPALSMRRASGLSSSMRRRHARVSASRSASGTSLLTSPMSSACWASYCSRRNQISRAFFWPTIRASRPAPYPPSKLPTRGPVWPKRALSAAMVRSQTTKNVPTADGISRHHRHHRLWQTADLDLEVEHVQPADALGVDIAVVAADPLVASRAEGLG